MKALKGIIFGIGLYKLGQTFVIPLYQTFLQSYATPLNPRQAFAPQNAYVAITGCTDGIGKGLALEFARYGFNLVLLARNLEKLNRLGNGLET